MAQTLPKMVQSAKGESFDVNSPQGKMIVNSPNYKPPFSASSSALKGGSTPPSKSMDPQETLEGIKTSVEESALSLKTMEPNATSDALNKANVLRDDDGPIPTEGDDGVYREDEGSSSSKGGGFLSKLFGGSMAGAGLLVGGFGALLAGGGVLLEAFNNFDGEKFKKNIESIMSIVPSITSPGAAAAFAADTGLFLITMTQLGLGMAAFGIGSAVTGLADKFLALDAQGIKDNVTTLLSIGDMYGEGWKGSVALVGKSATFLASMTTIGVGLAIFGMGSAVAGIGDGLNQGIESFTTVGWAQSIVDNVTVLLGISKLFDGLGDAFIKNGTFLVAMTSIGAGLAIFGLGSAAAGVADGVTQGIDSFTKKGWAQSIVDNVTTLLSINNLFTGFKDVLTKGGTFVVAMTAITAGLALFAFGSAAAGAVTGALDVTDWAIREEGMTWSKSIVDHVTTLLSIASLPNVGTDTAKFALTMGGISAGLLAFGVGSFFATGADSLSEWLSGSVTDFKGSSWSDKIKEKVTTLLSIVSNEGGKGATVQNSLDFVKVMGNLSSGLLTFAGKSFGSSLLNLGSQIFNFLAGGESPIDEMVKLADKADDLTKASSALDSLAGSLEKISKLKFDGSKINMKAFARDLAESVPVIETAIMGGNLDAGFFDVGEGNIKFKGLASPDINFADAIQNIRNLRGALGVELLVAPNGTTQQLKNATSTMMTSDGPKVIIAPTDNSIKSNISKTTLIELDAIAKDAAVAAFMGTLSMQ